MKSIIYQFYNNRFLFSLVYRNDSLSKLIKIGSLIPVKESFIYFTCLLDSKDNYLDLESNEIILELEVDLTTIDINFEDKLKKVRSFFINSIKNDSIIIKGFDQITEPLYSNKLVIRFKKSGEVIFVRRYKNTPMVKKENLSFFIQYPIRSKSEQSEELRNRLILESINKFSIC